MKAASALQSTSFAAFIGSLVLCVLFYIFLYVTSLSKPVYIRVLFTIASFSGSAFAFYCFSTLQQTPLHWAGKIGLIVVFLHFILLLFTIWYNASFLARNWLMLEISSIAILLSGIAVLVFKHFSGK
jgi:hypothetical protein